MFEPSEDGNVETAAWVTACGAIDADAADCADAAAFRPRAGDPGATLPPPPPPPAVGPPIVFETPRRPVRLPTPTALPPTPPLPPNNSADAGACAGAGIDAAAVFFVPNMSNPLLAPPRVLGDVLPISSKSSLLSSSSVSPKRLSERPALFGRLPLPLEVPGRLESLVLLLVVLDVDGRPPPPLDVDGRPPPPLDVDGRSIDGRRHRCWPHTHVSINTHT